MQLGPTPKQYTHGGHHAVDPETTLKRIEPLAKTAGITRTADITDLDRVGIPVFSSIRPSAESGAISVYNGKGLTNEEAKVSSIMEGIERYCAEVRDSAIIRAGTEEFMNTHNALNPMSLILPQMAAYNLGRYQVGWVEGFELNSAKNIWVPASAVFHPYTSKMDLMLFRTSTNGLASGNTLEEAALHGLLEVIERDAWSIVEFHRKLNGDIQIPDCGMVKDLVDKFESKGIEVHLKDLTSDIGIPTIAAATDDVEMQDPALLTLGIGTHLDAEVAAVKALLEVAQSRLTQIHGAREDTVRGEAARKLGYERMKRLNKLWLENSENTISLNDFPQLVTDDIFDDLQITRAKLNSRGLNHTILVDLTREEIGIPVVKAIVPGMEIFALDDERVGPRVMNRV